jgi:glycosyltransferase involved in cell wall biosynthesis
LNILFIISSLKFGGAEKQTVIDANMFAERHNVFVVVFREGELEELLSDKVKLFVLNKNGYFRTAKKVKRIIVDENIQVVNSSLFASMIISVLSARRTNIPVIWYFHSHEYDAKLKSKIAYRFFSKFNCLKKIFFVSNELKNSFEKNGYRFPINKQGVVYNTNSVNINKKNNIETSSNVVIIGYIGRLVGLKRVEYLLDAADYLKKNDIHNFIINIIGDGELKNKLIKYSEQLKVNDKVKFLGYKSDVERYYKNFNIFMLPSREECLSIALIDACIYSLPCIAFNVGGNDEIIINEKTGYIVKNKSELFEKLKILIIDENKRKEMGKEAKEYCADKFDKNKKREYLENIFKNLIIDKH